MSFNVEKFISNFIKSQFPSFYETEGENFILFLEAYYEWLEQEGQAISEARNLLDYRDIDTPIEGFLVHFQKKYLYGIPYSIISDKRLLLKHILDIYRSKGTIRGYKLLFKLIYNQDIDVYLPAYDILKASDGTWIQPKYLEVTDSPLLSSLVGKQIIGSVSNTIATVEKFNIEPINKNIISNLYISNISPQGGEFIVGEKILRYPNTGTYSLYDAPEVIGSLNTLKIISGGNGFNPGDTLSIAENDPNTGERIAYGSSGRLKVTKTYRSSGALEFILSEKGFGYTPNTSIYLYKQFGDNSGHDASFDIGPLSYTRRLTYNTDIIYNYKDVVFNAFQYGFPYNHSANSEYQINQTLYYTNNTFGTIFSLQNVKPGNNYIYPPEVLIRSSIVSKPIGQGTIYYSNADNFVLTTGSISYNNTSLLVTGTDTLFKSIFSNGDVIGLKNINTLPDIQEYHIITSVDSNTQLTLAENPTHNSTGVSVYYKVPYVVGNTTPFTSIYSNNDVIVLQSDPNDDSTKENNLIKTVVNSSLIILYGAPKYNSNSNISEYFIAPSLMTSQFALYEPIMYTADKSIPGFNTVVTAIPNNGNSTVNELVVYNSGKGYVEGEIVNAYLDNILSPITIVSSGSGYANGEQLTFVGGTSQSGGINTNQANGFITTNVFGNVVGVSLLSPGANYYDVPLIGVASANGHGAVFSTSIAPPDKYNTYSMVTGTIVKSGIGISPGYWSTTRGFLNSNKYLQDSYFYQDYSYQIKVANTLDKYKKIIYDTFHSSGMELFGEYLAFDSVTSNTAILWENKKPITKFLTADDITIFADTTTITCDATY